MKAVLTVIGKDKVGIIASISRILAEYNINILNISQSIMGDLFTMMMMVDIGGMSVAFSTLSDELKQKGIDLGLEIRIQKEEIFNSMHRI